MTVGDLSMIKAAIIGLGWWGQHIVSTLQNKSEKIRFVRAVDLNLEASQQVAAQHLELSSDLGDALEDAEVEAIVLATPHSLHEAQILASASAGKHVFCEAARADPRERGKVCSRLRRGGHYSGTGARAAI